MLKITNMWKFDAIFDQLNKFRICTNGNYSQNQSTSEVVVQLVRFVHSC